MTVAVVCSLFQPDNKTPSVSRCYSADWVRKLKNGFDRHTTIPHRFVCVTDEPKTVDQIEGVEAVELCLPHRGWAAIMEVFRPDVLKGDRLFWIGLDSILVGNCDELLQVTEDRVLAENPSKGQPPANPIVLASNDAATEVWGDWSQNHEAHVSDPRYCHYASKGTFSEMVYLQKNWPDVPVIESILGRSTLFSFKCHIAKGPPNLPKGAQIIYFHGTPKPPQLRKVSFVKEHWR